MAGVELDEKYARAMHFLPGCKSRAIGWRSTSGYPTSNIANFWYMGTQREEVQAAVDDAKVKFAGLDAVLTRQILHTAVFAVEGGKHFIGWMQLFIGSSTENACIDALEELCWEVDGYPAPGV